LHRPASAFFAASRKRADCSAEFDNDRFMEGMENGFELRLVSWSVFVALWGIRPAGFQVGSNFAN
jgi:hypothetical protein